MSIGVYLGFSGRTSVSVLAKPETCRSTGIRGASRKRQDVSMVLEKYGISPVLRIGSAIFGRLIKDLSENRSDVAEDRTDIA